MGRNGSFSEYPGRRSAPPDDGSDARDCGGGAGKFDADRASGRVRKAPRRGVSTFGQHRQYHDSAVGRVHRRSHARRARGGNGRKARRAGAGAGGGGNPEGPRRLRKIPGELRGEILQLKEAINTMVDQLRSFASEVTRVAREVGTDGKLGGQAVVVGVAGTWKDLTDSVNAMAGNLTAQVRNIAEVTTAVARGDLSRKITVDVKGEILELKDTINTMVDQLNAFAGEVTRVAREVGTEGKLGGQAVVTGVAGTWKDLTDSVNSMASNLTNQVRNIAEVTTAVAKGDLTTKITVDARGEI